MKTIKKCGAQWDLLISRVPKSTVPKGLTKRAPEAGRQIVAHSETGHHHYLDATGVVVLTVPNDPLVCYLQISGDFADLQHARPYDTHETIRLPKGSYELRRQREYVPGGWRRVED